MKITSVEQVVNRYISDHVDHVAIDHKTSIYSLEEVSPSFLEVFQSTN